MRESDHYIEISKGFVKFSIKPSPGWPDQRLPVPVIMYETCRNFLSDPAADNKNARKKRPGEAPFALTPIKNRIFVIAPSKSCLFLKQPKYGFSGLRVSE